MGQPSTSAQIRAVALKEAVASFNGESVLNQVTVNIHTEEDLILKRAERFASYIEHGEEHDPNA